MSGGPALDADGRVMGVNVAKRLDGELVSFLVPAPFARALLDEARKAPVASGPLYETAATQLLEHQERLTRALLERPLGTERRFGYAVPVPDHDFVRCWAQDQQRAFKVLKLEHISCVMDTQLVVDNVRTGGVTIRHETYDGTGLGTLRFTRMYSKSFENEAFLRFRTEDRTVAKCHERYVDASGLPLRAVICFNAYTRLRGLFDMSLLVTTMNQPMHGVQGRIDARGITYENGLKLAEYYLKGYAWQPSP